MTCPTQQWESTSQMHSGLTALLASCGASWSLFGNGLTVYVQSLSRPNPQAGKDTDILPVLVQEEECKLAPH